VQWNKDAPELRLRYSSHRGSSIGEIRWTARDVAQQAVVPFQVVPLVWMAFAPSLVTSSVVPGSFETCSADGSHAVHDLVAAIRFSPALAVRLLLVQSGIRDGRFS